MAETASECVSCGSSEVDPKSERGFCKDCEAHFAEGQKRQQYVLDRAERLEQAKVNRDKNAVKDIMGEISMEAVEVDNQVLEGIEMATAAQAVKTKGK